MPNYNNGKIYSIRSYSNPDLIYIVEKNKKQKKKKEKKIKQKISPSPKNKKQKKNISTFDLIANLVKNANIANTSEDNNIKYNIKTEVKEEENVSQKKFFRTNLKGNNGIKKKKKLFKKKVSKNKNKDEKKIIVREFNHDEFKMTQYIDENNNIWNDKHKLIGRFDETENTIMCI